MASRRNRKCNYVAALLSCIQLTIGVLIFLLLCLNILIHTSYLEPAFGLRLDYERYFSLALWTKLNQAVSAEQGDIADVKTLRQAKHIAAKAGVSVVIAIPAGRLAPNACGQDGVYLKKTLKAILDATGSNLAEVIIVDDGTHPALSRPHLDHLVWEDGYNKEWHTKTERPLLVWIRHDSPKGMSAARNTGGDLANAQVIAFFDCYVKPLQNWIDPILKTLEERPRAVALPAIQDLDPHSWDVRAGKNHFDNLFTWEAETVQLYFDPQYITWPFPIDQGNILVLRRAWWQELGGYDGMMRGSSTLLIESIDLSLKVLLCGGEFVPMADSIVGFCHEQHGTLHHEREDIFFNQARIISSWFGDWRARGLKQPRFADFAMGRRSVGDLSTIRSLQDRLHCSDLSTFLTTYALPLEILGLASKEAYSLQEATTGLCLQELDKDRWVMAACAQGRGQLFVGKNARVDLKGSLACCAGLGPRFPLSGSASYCLDARNGHPGPYECSFWPPTHDSQQWQLTAADQLENPQAGCLAPSTVETSAQETQVARVRWGPCQVVSPGKAAPHQHFTLQHIAGSTKFMLALESGRCLSAQPSPDGQQNAASIQTCNPADGNQHWAWLKESTKIGLRTSSDPARCVDLNAGHDPLVYTCYSMTDSTAPGGIQNTNQALWLTDAGHISQWGPVDMSFTNLCLDGSPTKEAKLRTLPCEEAIRMGVRWKKVGVGVPEETRLLEQRSKRISAGA